MSKVIKKVAPIALPILGSAIPGIGTILGSALGGAAGGLVSGGGLKGALKGAAFSGLTAGAGNIIGSAGTPINWTSAAPGYSTGLQTVGGSGVTGALSRALGGSGVGQAVGQGVGQGAGALVGTGGGTSGSTLGGGGIGNIASNVFSGIQGTDAYKDMQRQQLGANQQALSAISPFAATGQAANTQLAGLLGLDPNANQDDILGQLRATPGYDFQMQQGQQAMDRSQAARGGFFSGEALKASQQYGQGLADQMYNDAVSRLQQQSGQGLNAAGAQADLFSQAGDIRANTTLGKSNLLSQTLANILNPV